MGKSAVSSYADTLNCDVLDGDKIAHAMFGWAPWIHTCSTELYQCGYRISDTIKRHQMETFFTTIVVEYDKSLLLQPDSDIIDHEKLKDMFVNDKQNYDLFAAHADKCIKDYLTWWYSFYGRQGHAEDYERSVCIWDMPLWYEKNLDAEFKAQGVEFKTIVVDCDEQTQAQRVMARPKMTTELFMAIKKEQLPNSVKTKKADFVIDTSGSIEQTQDQFKTILSGILLTQ